MGTRWTDSRPPHIELLGRAGSLILLLSRNSDDELTKLAQQWRQDYRDWQTGDYGPKYYTHCEHARPSIPDRIDGVCAWCRQAMETPAREQGGGRTKRFCSPACKQAHHRWSRDPERYPDAQTWTLERQT